VVASAGPTHQGVVEDLRWLREHGVTAIRAGRLPDLFAAAELAGFAATAETMPAATEALLRAAIDRLGSDLLEKAASYTFGTRREFRGASAHERREAARRLYGVSPERFRKAQERVVIAQVAEMILALCGPDRDGTDGAAPHPAGPPAPGSPTRWVRTMPGREQPITLHVGPVELVRDVDVLVTSTNTYFELSHTFGRSLSAAVRRAAAHRDAETGEIVDDVISRELVDRIDRSHRRGLSAVAGTVLMTTSGCLIDQGVQRVMHAAIAAPRPSDRGYHIDPGAISVAVRNAFRVASEAHDTGVPALRSICFPLFGSGCAALPRQQSLDLVLAFLAEIPVSEQWVLHLLTLSGSGIDYGPWRRQLDASG
jgi:O-acetyl-ADP-ribose deacetylase (regulator of RNase III)